MRALGRMTDDGVRGEGGCGGCMKVRIKCRCERWKEVSV